MRIMFQTREVDGTYSKPRQIEVSRLPVAGEYIAIGGSDGGLYRVGVVIHHAGCEGAGAEVLCEWTDRSRAWQAVSRQGDAGAKLLTIEQAATAAQVSVKTIRRLCQGGRLECANYGGAKRADYRITPEALAKLQAVPVSAPPDAMPILPPSRPRRRPQAPRPGKQFDVAVW
jgi:hypothetical protein